MAMLCIFVVLASSQLLMLVNAVSTKLKEQENVVV
jgi:hypothetical protein